MNGRWSLKQRGESFYVEYHGGPRHMRVISDPMSFLTKERATAVCDALNATEAAEQAASHKITMEPWMRKSALPIHEEGRP